MSKITLSKNNKFTTGIVLVIYEKKIANSIQLLQFKRNSPVTDIGALAIESRFDYGTLNIEIK